MDSKAGQKTHVARAAITRLSTGSGRIDEGREEGYCIRCAVSQADFRERAPLTFSMPPDGGQQPRAWIGGRSYALLHHFGARVSCICCGEEAWTAYCPEDTRAC
jgi:hypothetical protein